MKSNDWLQSLNTCFKTVGETIGIDRIYFFQNNLKDKTTSQRLEWSNENIIPQLDNQDLQNIPFSELPLFMEPLLKKKNFEAIVKDLPQSITKDLLLKQEIKSILVLPLWVNDFFMVLLALITVLKRENFQKKSFN